MSRLLTSLEETQLLQQCRQGGKIGMVAKNKLIRGNIRLVHHYVRRSLRPAMLYDDLLQEGLIGLNTAIDKFDISSGYRLSTYATFWIRQKLGLAIAKQSSLIRRPIGNAQLIARLANAEHELGPGATDEAISKKLGCTLRRLKAIRDSRLFVMSFDTLVAGDADNGTFEQFISDDAQQVAETCNKHDKDLLKQALLEVINELSTDEADAILLRYGFADGTCYGLREIGKILAMSHEGARKLIAKAEHQLKLRLAKDADKYKEAIS